MHLVVKRRTVVTRECGENAIALHFLQCLGFTFGSVSGSELMDYWAVSLYVFVHSGYEK